MFYRAVTQFHQYFIFKQIDFKNQAYDTVDEIGLFFYGNEIVIPFCCLTPLTLSYFMDTIFFYWQDGGHGYHYSKGNIKNQKILMKEFLIYLADKD